MIKRLIFSIFVAFFSTFLCFVLLNFSKASVAFSSNSNMQSKEFVKRLEKNLELDKPLLKQYKNWLFKALKGDFGTSLLYGQSVLKLIKERLFNTVILGSCAFFMLFILSIFLAFLSFHFKDSFIEKLITFLTLNFFALPSFVLALLFVLIFSFFWQILPSSMNYLSFEYDFLEYLKALIMPILVLVLSHLAIFLRITRTIINESFSQIFVHNFYARGLRQSYIYYLVLRYSLASIVAYFGANILSFLMQTYIIESVFSYAGLGNLLFKSVIFNDYPVVLALVFFSVLLVAFFSFCSDFLAKILSPRGFNFA